MKGILALKDQMTTFFDKEGRVHSATLVQAGPCLVSALRSKEKDNYEAVQFSFGQKSKAAKGNKKVPLYLREIRGFSGEDLSVGKEIKVGDIFEEGDLVAVTGFSKGKGFAGVVKRWHFEGGPRTHGQSDRERAPGSSGSTTTPGRVFKGKRMAGKMGRAKTTVKNLRVLKVDTEKNVLFLEGAVPGSKNNLLIVKKL